MALPCFAPNNFYAAWLLVGRPTKLHIDTNVALPELISYLCSSVRLVKTGRGIHNSKALVERGLVCNRQLARWVWTASQSAQDIIVCARFTYFHNHLCLSLHVVKDGNKNNNSIQVLILCAVFYFSKEHKIIWYSIHYTLSSPAPWRGYHSPACLSGWHWLVVTKVFGLGATVRNPFFFYFLNYN